MRPVRLVLMAAVVVSVSCVNSLRASYSGGSGTPEDPYQIATVADLIALGANTADYGKCFMLTADIDLAGQNFNRAVIAPDTDTANGGFQGLAFTGVFDGNNYMISSLTISDTVKDYLGLFGYLGLNGQVKRLKLENVNITGRDQMGGLCGYNDSGTICQTSITGLVKGKTVNIGGLCGVNNSGLISQSEAKVTVYGRFHSGGLCGNNSSGIIRECSSSGLLITNSGIVAGVGGLCGSNSGTIRQCYSSSAIKSAIYPSSYPISIGGLCGENGKAGIIDQCYSCGLFTAEADKQVSVGGLCGSNTGIINSSFWDINASGLTTSAGGTGKTIIEMQQITTFTNNGWDFDAADGDPSDWKLTQPGRQYPLLAWQEDVPVTKDYSGGSGTVEDPYQIATAADLIALGANTGDYDKHFIVIQSVIYLSGFNFSQALIAPDIDNATSGFQGVAFTGVFDGKQCKIVNYTCSGEDYIGFWGMIGAGGLVKNTRIVNSNLTGVVYLGGLCGYNNGQVLSCSTESDTITGKERIYIGGLCGYNKGLIQSCSSKLGTITSLSYCVGGVVGCNEGNIETTYADCTIMGGSYSFIFGGLCGLNLGIIESSYATGTTKTGSEARESYCYSSFCGANDGQIRHCYATGETWNYEYSYGGICADNRGIITDCFWDITMSQCQSSEGGWGLTSAQMKQAASFFGWNNGNWTIRDGVDYPRLFWEKPADPLITTDYPVRTYSGGGTMEDPFQIATAADLSCLRWRTPDWSAHFIMTGNISLAGTPFANAVIANGGSFTGVFDGRGHTIDNLIVNGSNQSMMGLFYRMGSGSQVCHLGLSNVKIAGRNYLGGICGINEGSIRQCFVAGKIDGSYFAGGIGGLCGVNEGVISQSYASVIIDGGYLSLEFGGLCGNNQGVISQCYSAGRAFAEVGPQLEVLGAGLCSGNHNPGILSDSFWDVDTSGQTKPCLEIIPPGIISNVQGLTTVQMQTQASFTAAGWDFAGETANGAEDIWHMPFGSAGYPMLWWQKDIPGDLAGGYGVDMEDYLTLSTGWLCSEGANLTGLLQLVEHWLEGR